MQVYTRLAPFSNTHSDMRVLMKVVAHEHPSRPSKEDCHGAEMSDDLWDLISRCWLKNAAERPHIKYVTEVINHITF